MRTRPRSSDGRCNLGEMIRNTNKRGQLKKLKLKCNRDPALNAVCSQVGMMTSGEEAGDAVELSLENAIS